MWTRLRGQRSIRGEKNKMVPWRKYWRRRKKKAGCKCSKELKLYLNIAQIVYLLDFSMLTLWCLGPVWSLSPSHQAVWSRQTGSWYLCLHICPVSSVSAKLQMYLAIKIWETPIKVLKLVIKNGLSREHSDGSAEKLDCMNVWNQTL